MSSVGPKQQVFAGLAQIAQALGHAHRLELLEHLGQGERSVEDLAARASLTIANASRHLQLLRRAALVEGRRDGKRVYYRLAGDDVVVGLRSAAATVLDVRPEDEFANGHLPDALNIPLSQLERRLTELPPDQEIVAYCRGPWCVLSFEAVALLRQRGYRARRLEDGFPEWKTAGLPTSQSQPPL